MIEHRLTRRLHKYWNNLKKDKDLPRFSQFNSSAISDIWSNCVLMAIQPTAAGKAAVLSFAEIGDHVRTIYGNDMVGKTFSTAQRHFQGARIMRHTQEVITTKQCLFDEGQFVSSSNSRMVKYRSCLMPFSNKDGRVTHIIIGLTWREY